MLSSTFRRVALSCFALLPVVHAAVFEVVVGGPGTLRYTPESVNAQPGDQIRFIFQQKNHTATQSTFENPCVKAPGGFDSGYVPVADGVTDGFPVAELNITSTDPVWVYCKQGTHCQAGMVFAVNPGDRMAAFKAAATGAATPSASTTSSAPTSSSTSTGTVHRIVVGGPGALTFNPSNINAAVGDTIEFEFRQKNHTVTASTFDAPCVPLAQSFDSGYVPVADGAATFPTWSIRVNDTRPIWAFCKQGNHCGQGMVFAANAVEPGKTFVDFQNLARQLNGTVGGSTGGGGYGSGALQTSVISSAGAVLAAVFAIAFLL